MASESCLKQQSSLLVESCAEASCEETTTCESFPAFVRAIIPSHVCSQSLLTFELFSVMVHSGSAAGGHYYACIKSFSDGQWYSFNDQHVSKVSLEQRSRGVIHRAIAPPSIRCFYVVFCCCCFLRHACSHCASVHFSGAQITQEDIRKTHGGSSGSRGYYSSAFARFVKSDSGLARKAVPVVNNHRASYMSMLPINTIMDYVDHCTIIFTLSRQKPFSILLCPKQRFLVTHLHFHF